MQETQETRVRSLGGEDPLEKEMGRGGSPLKYSCLENCMDREAWRATIHGAAKSWTWLSTEHSLFLRGIWEAVSLPYVSSLMPQVNIILNFWVAHFLQLILYILLSP